MDWRILNLPRRKDRRVLSVANALRLDVPPDRISFWEAKDADDFESGEAIIEAIVADGFPEFGGKPPNNVHLGKNCHIWNVCRFLRELSVNKGPHTMFCHDGIIFATAGMTFFTNYNWFCDTVAYLDDLSIKRGTGFKFLQIGHVDFSQGRKKLVAPGSMIVDGIVSCDNFARIYSPGGARLVLQRILDAEDNYRTVGPNGVLQTDILNFAGDSYWEPEGAYSTAITLVRDMPNQWLGSDTVDIPMLRDGFGEMLEKDTEVQAL